MAIFRCPECEKYVFPKLNQKRIECASCGAKIKVTWVEKRLFYDRFEIGRALHKVGKTVTSMPVSLDLKTLTWLEEH